MPYRPIYDPQLWRSRALATRLKADSLSPGKPKDRLLKVAEEYDKLARYAERCDAHGTDQDSDSCHDF